MLKTIAKSFVMKSGLAAAALAVIVGLGGGLLSYRLTRTQLEQMLHNELDSRARLIATQLSNELRNVMETLADMAQNTLFANALADSTGRDHYLRPFLSSFHKVGTIPVQVVLSDFRGRPLESNFIGPQVEFDEAMLKLTVESGEAQFRVDRLNEHDVAVTLAWPILYANTGLPEGALGYKFVLSTLSKNIFAQEHGESFRALFDLPETNTQVSVIQGSPPPEHAIFRRSESPAPELFGNWRVTVEVWESQHRLTEELSRLALRYLMLAGIGLALIVPAGLIGARHMLARLKVLEHIARNVVDTRSFDQKFSYKGDDEIAALGQAFNHMLTDLQQANQELRDESLREIKLQSERFRKILSATVEGYVRVDAQTGRIEEVNEAFCRMTGQGRELWEGRHAPEFLHPVLARAGAADQPTAAWMQEILIGVREGRDIACLLTCSLLSDDEGQRQIVVFLTNITERKKR